MQLSAQKAGQSAQAPFVNSSSLNMFKVATVLQQIMTELNVALFSETHLKPHETFYISNYHLYQTDRFPGRKGGTAIAVRKGISHSHVDLPPLVSVEDIWSACQ
jgi:hypothetical protein